MFRQPSNEKERFGSLSLLAIAAVLLAALSVKLVAFAVTSPRGWAEQTDPNSLEQQDKKVLEKSLAAGRELAGALKEKNAFTPPPSKPSPPSLSGAIMGDKALMNGSWHGVGDEVAGAKVLAVGVTAVTVEWQGKEMELKLPGVDIPVARRAPVAEKTKEAVGPVQVQEMQQEVAAEIESSAKQPWMMSFDEVFMLLPASFRSRITPEQKEQMRQKWNSMTEEQKKAVVEQFQANQSRLQ